MVEKFLGGAPRVILKFLARFMKNSESNFEEIIEKILKAFREKITGDTLGEVLYQPLEEILVKFAEEITGIVHSISLFKVPPKLHPDLFIFF